MLFGPGVKLVTNAYNNNDNIDISVPPFIGYVIMSFIDNITSYALLYIANAITQVKVMCIYGRNKSYHRQKPEIL